MAQLDHYIHSEEIHPIDIAETVATHHAWDFDRLADDQIAMTVEGQWRSYSLTLAWSAREAVRPALAANHVGLGRELFAMMRKQVGSAEQGACALFLDEDEGTP